MKNYKGFTLIEVIVVMVLIGLMTTFAIQRYTDWLPNYRLKKAARGVYGAAMKAKGEAVKRNINCALTFNQSVSGTTNVYVVYEDLNGNCEFDTGETVIKKMEKWPDKVSLDTSQGGGDGLSFTDNDDGNPTISFRPNAIPTANGGGLANGSAYLINTNGQTKEVVINRAGSIRID